MSPCFDQYRGRKQGDLLLASIFALDIKPLAESICSDLSVYRYNTDKTNNKILLYANDVVLYIGHIGPQVTIPKLLEKICSGHFLGIG